MSTFTENYSLIKPDEEDYYDVNDFNENMDTIDAQLFATEQSIDGVSEKIGSSADSGVSTVFGQLNQIHSAVSQGGSMIKSIQRVVVSIKTNNQNSTTSINTVDTAKCIVLMDIMTNADVEYSMNYTLNTNNIYVETTSGYTKTVSLSFWIIEFY